MGWWQKLTGQKSEDAPKTASIRSDGSGQSLGQFGDIGRFARLLTPPDFAAVGVAGAGSPKVNFGEPDSAYIVYSGKSGATGGIELDVFWSDDPEGVFTTATGECAAPTQPIHELGADEAMIVTGVDNGHGGKWSGITVRRGRLVFCLSIPDSTNAKNQLCALAKLVLIRSTEP